MTSKNDTPETQIQLMMKRDSLDGDILRWEAARDKHAKRISEIHEYGFGFCLQSMGPGTIAGKGKIISIGTRLDAP